MTRSPFAARRAEEGGALLLAVRSCVLLVLATPLIVTPETIFPYVVGKGLFARSAIEVAFALWLALAFRQPAYRPPRSWVLLAFGAWALVSLAAAFAGVSATRSLWSTFERMQGVLDLAHWLAFAVVASSVFRSSRDWRQAFGVHLAVASAVALLGLGRHFGLLGWGVLVEGPRLASTLGNAAYLGAYAMSAVIAGLALLADSLARGGAGGAEGRPAPRAQRRRELRARRRGETAGLPSYVPWLWTAIGIAIAANLLALWLSGTRGALIGLGVGLVAFAVGCVAWVAMRWARRAAWGVLAAAALAAALVGAARAGAALGPLEPLAGTTTLTERLLAIGPEDTSVRGRLTSIEAGLRASADRPLLGWGPENFFVAWGRHVEAAPDSPRWWFDQAHSKAVEELTTKGAAGLLAYLLLWLAMARAILGAIRRRRGAEQLFALILGGAVAAEFAHGLFLVDAPTSTMLFALFAAWAASLEHRAPRADGAPGASAPRGGARAALMRAARPLRTRAGGAAAGAALAAATLAGLWLFGLRAYDAAHAAYESGEALPWAEQRALYREASSAFPPLAGHARLQLISQARSRIPDFAGEELADAFALIGREGRRGLAAEPRNWRLHAALAGFWQAASDRDPARLEEARLHADAVLRLAPGTVQTADLLEAQARLEEEAREPPEP